MSISHGIVGWSMLLAALLTIGGGIALRTFLGRRRDNVTVQRIVGWIRSTPVGRVLFGRLYGDALDDAELDSMILIPTFVLGCGLCLTAIYLLGYGVVT